MTALSLRKRGSIAILAAIAIVAASRGAMAWGRLGHRVAGKIADARLSPNAKKAIGELLAPGETLADVSSWADDVRRDRPESGPWHYVNVNITEPRFDRKFSPAKTGSVISAIEAMEKTLADPTAPKLKRTEALKYLAHFIEDMHQPLHVGHREDKGGNELQVRWFDDGKNPRAGSNLHRVWDSSIIEQHSTDEKVWYQEVDALATPDNMAKWSKGSIDDWATESLLAAKKAYLDGNIKPGAKLGQDYEDMALPIVRLRLAQAGTRLASELNRIFP